MLSAGNRVQMPLAWDPFHAWLRRSSIPGASERQRKRRGAMIEPYL